MEKYFVTYEQALALKELGFNKKCFNLFDKNGSLMYKPNGNIVMIKIDNHNKTNFCSAPLKSQVFEWFRKNHLLGHEINCPFVSYSGKNAEIINEGRYEMFITDEDQLSISDKEFYSTDYFEAESKAIDKLIEIVKNGR